MDPYVDIQVSSRRETLPTDRALKGLLTRVTAHVEIELMAVPESFTTTHTHLGFLSPVLQLVSCQTGHRAEVLPTLRARSGQVGRMDPLVRSQLSNAGERFPTPSAREDPALAVRHLMLTQQVLRLKAFSALRTVKLWDTTLVFESLLH